MDLQQATKLINTRYSNVEVTQKTENQFIVTFSDGQKQLFEFLKNPDICICYILVKSTFVISSSLIKTHFIQGVGKLLIYNDTNLYNADETYIFNEVEV